MSEDRGITRRRMMGLAMAGATSMVAGAGEQKPQEAAVDVDPKVQGPFLILSTPFTESGAVDYEVLANQARFMDWCGCPGMIWPQSGDSVDLLTMEEKLKGMEVLGKTARTLKTTGLCLGVQGKDTEEMLVYAKHAEKQAPTAIISRPPDSGKTQDDMLEYWRALAGATKRPVIIQTTGGVAYKGKSPSTDLLVQLGKEFTNFGYVKEEAGGVISRMRILLEKRPPIRRVFGARGGLGWLYELNLGAEGLITERAVYADLLTGVWELHKSGKDPDGVRDAYSKFLLMTNLSKTHPGNSLRGIQLYLYKKRGVFKNMISRHYGKGNAIPEKPIFNELKLSQQEIAEVEFRFEALKPYLKPGKPSFA